MSAPSPTSRSSLSIQYSLFDAALAALAPLLALSLRNAPVLNWSEQGLISAGGYCLLSLIFSLMAFTVFRIHSAIPRYLSINDIIVVAKAVFLGEFLTCAVLFSVTRLDGIPRSTPAIHALVLGAGLIMARTLVYLIDSTPKSGQRTERASNVILIGLNDLSVRFMELLQASAGGTRRNLIGVLDSQLHLTGRSVNGVRVFGPPAHLEALIDEFATHGVKADLVVVGSEGHELSKDAVSEIRRVCSRRKIELMFLSEVFDVGRASHPQEPFRVLPVRPATASINLAAPSPYFRFKRPLDVLVAAAMMIILLPLWLIVAGLALVDVGSPVIFWQQRIGIGGRHFHLYKFRTLRASFDRQGQRVPEEARLSWIGRLLRVTRLDEMPQLLNVIGGDMSLVGPRPLLIEDQPPNPAVRLMVRPGITGWAQVNGGALLSAVEKDQLDAWYVVSASVLVDLRIAWMTAVSFVRGDRRPQQAVPEASTNTQIPTVLQVGTSRRATSFSAKRKFDEEKGRASTALSS
jgi:lipopolysaccharide/colanic/teichoic acid biosynthesis glycosyltransferase